MKRILPLLLAAGLFQVTASAEDKPAKGDGECRPLPEWARQFDKNGDGKLDDSEREAAKAAYLAKKGAENKGGDGGAKMEQYRAEMLKKYDTNGDGKLDEEEKQAA